MQETFESKSQWVRIYLLSLESLKDQRALKERNKEADLRNLGNSSFVVGRVDFLELKRNESKSQVYNLLAM